jgi:hypothetical protein
MSEPPSYPPPGQFPVPPVAPTSGKAVTSLVLGIVSIVMCGLFLGIPAMIVSRQAKREIAESRGTIGGGGMATAGFVTGLIGTIWSVVAAIIFVLLIIFGVTYADKHCEQVIGEDGSSTLRCD